MTLDKTVQSTFKNGDESKIDKKSNIVIVTANIVYCVHAFVKKREENGTMKNKIEEHK